MNATSVHASFFFVRNGSRRRNPSRLRYPAQPAAFPDARRFHRWQIVQAIVALGTVSRKCPMKPYSASGSSNNSSNQYQPVGRATPTTPPCNPLRQVRPTMRQTHSKPTAMAGRNVKVSGSHHRN